ncbi:MAG: hypothetical protein D6160_14220 [Ketobacter sp.]|nr:MAG: hypothetical protein D6160_14220 [Ketobacter sp.]
MKYRSLLLAGAALQAGVVHAMGLGNIAVESPLGAHLNAQITLLSQQELTRSDVKISLASADVYARFGARDLVDHGTMRFDVIESDQGVLSARVMSTKRIQEPYIDMVVELRWPEGATYRRYEILLDPPQNYLNQSAALHPVSSRPPLAVQPKTSIPAKPVANPRRETRALQPADTMNSLKAQLLRLQRERAALLARRNAIRTELDSLKLVQTRVANGDLLSAAPASEVATLAIDDLQKPVPQAAQQQPVEAAHVQPVASPLLAIGAGASPAAQQSAIPLSGNIGLPIPSGALLQHLTAQDLLSSKNAVQAAVEQKEQAGFWYLLALLPLTFMLAFFYMRAQLVTRQKRADDYKDEDLYQLVFGAQRDRNRSEDKAQVGRALENIKAKAMRNDTGNHSVTPMLIEVQQDDSLMNGLALSEIEGQDQSDWMLDAPIRNMGR